MNKHFNLLLPTLALIILSTLVGCTRPESISFREEPKGKYKDYLLLEEVEIPNQKCIAQLYAQFEPYYGYNNLAVLLLEKETREPIFAEVNFWPTFKTATATHTTLTEPQYDSDYPFINHCGVVFTPQKDLVEDWKMQLYIRRRDGTTTDTLVLNLDIIEPEYPRVYEFTLRESGKYKNYYAALCNPLVPVSGNTSINIVIYRNEPANKIITPNNWSVEFEKSLDSNYFSKQLATASTIPGHYYVSIQNFDLPGIWKVRPIISGQKIVVGHKGYFFIPVIEEK